jgi:hypothetical protein
MAIPMFMTRSIYLYLFNLCDRSWFVNSDIFTNVPVVDMFWFVNSDIFTKNISTTGTFVRISLFTNHDINNWYICKDITAHKQGHINNWYICKDITDHKPEHINNWYICKDITVEQ